MWIFGYGSLMWNPGFDYHHYSKAIAHGYSLRMFQGNVHHRGNQEKPGRVATIVKRKNSYTCGFAFRIKQQRMIQTAIKYLYEREITNGYQFVPISVTILLHEGKHRNILAWTCIAKKSNIYFLGRTSTKVIADQILAAKGVCGANVDYLMTLTKTIREHFPYHDDMHLFNIERLLIKNLNTDISDNSPCIYPNNLLKQTLQL